MAITSDIQRMYIVRQGWPFGIAIALHLAIFFIVALPVGVPTSNIASAAAEAGPGADWIPREIYVHQDAFHWSLAAVPASLVFTCFTKLGLITTPIIATGLPSWTFLRLHHMIALRKRYQPEARLRAEFVRMNPDNGEYLADAFGGLFDFTIALAVFQLVVVLLAWYLTVSECAFRRSLRARNARMTV